MNGETNRAINSIFSWLGKIYWVAIILLLLNSCGYLAPPKELAPSGEIIKQALAFELEATEETLARQLDLASPSVKIDNIRIEKLQPLFVAKLPTYHLQGKYNFKLKLSRRQIEQKNRDFDVYLQRQVEGKTWRLLRKDKTTNSREWTSYLLPT
ncbi:hypothetical protein [Myxosarcina sp. GI1(2024)]